MTHKTLNTSLAAVALMVGAASLNAEVDTQSRLGLGADFKLDDEFTFNVATEQRLNNDVKTYYYGEYDLGVSWKALDWLTIAPTFRLAETRKNSRSSWVHEYRPMLNVSPSITLGGWKFEDRNRLEWRNYETTGADRIWRYRNRLKVTSPWKWTDLKINPYVSIELFNDLNGKNTALQNYEASVGVSAALTASASLDLYYMAEFKEAAGSPNTQHHTANIIGASVKFKF